MSRSTQSRLEKGARRAADGAERAVRRGVRFVRDFTGDLDRREIGRLFDEDAARAVSVLAGSDPEPAPRTAEEKLKRTALRTRDFFLGLAFKLSPPRRLLFAASLLVPLLGFLDLDFTLGPTRIYLDTSPVWFLVSLAGMTLLLALEMVDRLRVRDELEIARHLQRDLLPREAPLLPGYLIAHSYRTANEIGGDYYDFLPLDDGRVALAVGDASGHGIGAGLLMAISNASLKTAITLDPDPSAVLRLLNRTLCGTGDRRAFMTLFYGVLDLATGELAYGSGGHPFPLLRRRSGEILELGRGALPLGIRPGSHYEVDRVVFEPGDVLVLYSDGLPEAASARDEAFGFERLRVQAAIGDQPQEIHDRILQAVDAHLGGNALGDDLTLVVVRRI